MIFPPDLTPGNTIGITCPAGYMDAVKIQHCVETLHSWGYKTIVGKTIGSSSQNYFSDIDENRLNEFQQMIDDDSVNAILFGRGGYGTGRIIDRINFEKFKEKPKWLIGYSDITILHCHLSNFNIASIHSHMASAFDLPEAAPYIRMLKNCLEGAFIDLKIEPHKFNVLGKAQGKIIGGNLALLSNVLCTPSDFSTANKILFIEDIGEYIYNIDRMLHQLKRAGKFRRIAGLIFGSFSDIKDTERPFGISIEDVLKQISDDLNCPVCFNFPVGHTAKNIPIKIGADYELDITESVVEFKQIRCNNTAV